MKNRKIIFWERWGAALRNRIVQEDLVQIVREDLPWDRFAGSSVLVTGAAGILASYVAETLLYLNECRGLGVHVIGVVRDTAKARRRFAHYEGRSDLTIMAQDVCEPLSIDMPVDYIFHAAGQASPKFYGADPVGTLEGHILGTRNVLRLAHEKGIKGMLLFSSCDSYGELAAGDETPDKAIDEHYVGRIDPLSDRACYPVGKAAAEALCRAYALAYRLPVKILRIAHTYAPLMPLDDGRVFTDFIGNVLRGEDISLNSDGSAERPMLYIADAVRAYFRILLRGENGAAYNVAADENTSILELARLLVSLCPEKRLSVTFHKKKDAGYLPAPEKKIRISTEKLKLLGYRRRYSLEEGMRRTLESYMEERTS